MFHLVSQLLRFPPLTAHVRLGARTKRMNLLLGSALVVLGLFFAAQIPVLLGLLPVWALAAFLAYAGLRHALLVTDLRGFALAVAVVAGLLGAWFGNLAITAGVALGDMDGIRDFFDPNVVWHNPGKNRFSGDRRGVDEVLGQFAELFQFTNATFRLEVHDILANDEHVAILATAHAEPNGKTLAQPAVQILHVTDGKVTESWLHPLDQYANDEFFA